MKIKHYNTQTEEYEEHNLIFWRDGKFWKCKVFTPRDVELCQFMTKFSGRSEKERGLIGKGKTKEEALEDWCKWKNASDFVAAIY
jgi:hypothetical protein